LVDCHVAEQARELCRDEVQPFTLPGMLMTLQVAMTERPEIPNSARENCRPISLIPLDNIVDRERQCVQHVVVHVDLDKPLHSR
jgi:hypothetical protein